MAAYFAYLNMNETVEESTEYSLPVEPDMPIICGWIKKGENGNRLSVLIISQRACSKKYIEQRDRLPIDKLKHVPTLPECGAA